MIIMRARSVGHRGSGRRRQKFSKGEKQAGRLGGGADRLNKQRKARLRGPPAKPSERDRSHAGRTSPRPFRGTSSAGGVAKGVPSAPSAACARHRRRHLPGHG
eukprot:364794-Chlamydomonas_euryale.AAC.24